MEKDEGRVPEPELRGMQEMPDVHSLPSSDQRTQAPELEPTTQLCHNGKALCAKQTPDGSRLGHPSQSELLCCTAAGLWLSSTALCSCGSSHRAVSARFFHPSAWGAAGRQFAASDSGGQKLPSCSISTTCTLSSPRRRDGRFKQHSPQRKGKGNRFARSR